MNADEIFHDPFTSDRRQDSLTRSMRARLGSLRRRLFHHPLPLVLLLLAASLVVVFAASADALACVNDAGGLTAAIAGSSADATAPTAIELCSNATVALHAELPMTGKAFAVSCATLGTCRISSAAMSGGILGAGKRNRLFAGAPLLATFDGIHFVGGNAALSKPLQDPGSGGGGAFFISGGTVEFRNTRFSDNTAFRGGAVFIEGDQAAGSATNVSVQDSVFIDNTSTLSGGSIFIQGRASIAITRTQFESSHATVDGGAVYVKGDGADAKFVNLTFTNCSANIDGGAVYVFGGGAATMIQCTFNANRASIFGGALILGFLARNDAPRVSIEASTFAGNTALLAGGAIAVVGAGDLSLLSSTVFVNNTSVLTRPSDLFLLRPMFQNIVCKGSNAVVFCNGLVGIQEVGFPLRGKRKTNCDNADFSGTPGLDHCLYEQG